MTGCVFASISLASCNVVLVRLEVAEGFSLQVMDAGCPFLNHVFVTSLGKKVGRTSQLSGIGADFCGGCDGFYDGFFGQDGRILRRILWRIFVLCFP